MIGLFLVGCLANLSENPGMLVTTHIEKGGTWLPCPSSCKRLGEKLWGKCLSFPSGNWGSTGLSFCQLCNVGCLLKEAFFLWTSFRPQYPIGIHGPLEQSLLESLVLTAPAWEETLC